MRLSLFLLSLVSLIFGKVDINHAAKKELMGLKGIGEKKAEQIINYRDQHCFATLEELAEVKGISLSIVNQNREALTLSECKK